MGLTARAFGASRMLVDTPDEDLERTINSVTDNFGGHFSIITGVNPIKTLRGTDALKVHLTMYGLPMQDHLDEIRDRWRKNGLIVVVGASKVPFEFYEESDFNISVTNQPISEVSALGVFLDHLFQGKELDSSLRGKMTVEPSPMGKIVRVIPNEEQCVGIMKKFGASEQIMRHCKAVASLAVELSIKSGANVDLVRAGSLLHDIGRTSTNGIYHALIGSRILRETNVDERIVRIVERHTGAGIPKEEAIVLGLGYVDYVPVTLEEKIVAHADNLYSGESKMSLSEVLRKYNEKGLIAAAKRIEALHQELSIICGCDPETL